MRNNLWMCLWIFCIVVWSEIDASYIIDSIPPNGIVINAPGTYDFHRSIKWKPTSDSVAITIQSNDVTLNMQGHTLKCISSHFKTIGISAVGSANLIIKNGTLKNMGLSGIQCRDCSNILIKKIVVNGLNVKDTINYTVPTGILASQCFKVVVDECTVKNMRVRTGSSAAIQLTETLESKVTECHVKNLLNQDGACTGIGHLLCDDAVVDSCKLDTIKSEFIDNLNTEGHTAIGLVPVLTTNLKIQDCEISNIIGCCDDAHGISVFVCVGALVQNCKVSHVRDGLGHAQKGAKATGIEIYASGVKISDCVAKHILAINPGDKQATGFSCAFCTGVEFIRCKAKHVSVIDHKFKQRASLGYGTGFGWAPDPRPEFVEPAHNILYKDCIAEHCQVGFDSWFHIDSLWDGITSRDNKISILNQTDSQRTLSCDSCSECGCSQPGCYPNPYSVTITNVAANNQFLNVKIED